MHDILDDVEGFLLLARMDVDNVDDEGRWCGRAGKGGNEVRFHMYLHLKLGPLRPRRHLDIAIEIADKWALIRNTPDENSAIGLLIG